MKIISRYILKEHAGPLAFSFTALTSLLLLNYIARQLGQLVGKGLGWEVIGEFLLLSIPFTFAMTVPMAVLVSTLYAFSKLASENEVTAFKASGVSMWRLLTPVLLLGLLFTIGMLVFNDQVLPRANHRLAQLQYDIVRTKPTFALKEQVINELQRERLYLRASRVLEGTSRLKDVTVYDLSDASRRRTIYADSGLIAFAPNMRDLYLTLYDGVMQEVPTHTPAQLSRLFFRIDRIRVPDVGSQFQQTSAGQVKSDREMTICEMSHFAAIADRRRRLSYNELRAAEAAVARARGNPVPEPERLPLQPAFTLGRTYCDLITGGAQSREARAVAARDSAILAGQDAARDSAAARAAADPALIPLEDPEAQVARETKALRQRRAAPGMIDTASPLQPLEAAAGPLIDTAVVLQEAIMRRDEATFQVRANSTDANRYLVEIHKKFSLAVACFVFVLVGAPVALRFPGGGVGMTLGVSFAIFGLYYVGLISGESLADRDIVPPGIAMWTTNAIMLVVGTVLAARMGRESGSHRGGGGLADLVARVQYWMLGRRKR